MSPPDAAAAPATYAATGVDLAAADEAVARIAAAVASTTRPGVLGSIGGFAGRFALDTARYRRPVLVSSTDGVGTKMLVAKATGRYDTVGIDLVAMCVDDVVCTGAEPLFLLDYVAIGRLDPGRLEAIVRGVAEGCRQAGCALVGGETAEHPDAMAPDDVDLAGFALGAVEAGEELGPERVSPGDVLVGLPSPGLRSNGYTLARHVLLGRAGLSLDAPAWEGASHTLADELLQPSVIYA
ncbi:MAG: phosphoribosylformylglycinamidine cyclo-ligase, partial [Acidimicrobiales bacterium]